VGNGLRLNFDLHPPTLVEGLKGSTDPVTIHKENVEQEILNIEVMNRCAPSFSINGWPLRHSWYRYSISLR